MATAVQDDDDELEGIPLPKSKKKLFILIALVILVLSGIGAGVYYFLLRTAPAEEVAATAAAGTNVAAKEAPGKPPIFLALESFTVNLKISPGEDQQFLQIGISFQLRSEKSGDPIKQRMPQVRNRVLLLLTNSRASDLSTTEGKEKLVEQIMTQVNGLYPQMGDDTPVLGVFFTSFIIQ